MLSPVQQTQAWTRRDDPVLSTQSVDQTWCKVNLYSPCVLHHDGLYGHLPWKRGRTTGVRPLFEKRICALYGYLS